jgi:hypothetical protein
VGNSLTADQGFRACSLPLSLPTGELLKLDEGLGIEQRGTCMYACAARLLTGRAVKMVGGVACALLSAARACPDTSLEQAMDDEAIPLSWSRQDPGGDLAQVRAHHAQRDARAHLGDVILSQIRIRARRARLQTSQASINGRRELVNAARNGSRRGIKHVSGGGHSPTSST